jgi:hypothetical protein
MPTAIITGSGGLIGSESVRFLRDNIHAYDVVRAFAAFHANPRISMLEAIDVCELIAGRQAWGPESV